MSLFESQTDYEVFMRCLLRALQHVPIRLYAFCVMPNHFHLVVGPTRDGQIAEFMKRLTGRHSQRWHVGRGSLGTGAVYQGRYRAVPVQTDHHFLTLCRYVERNALRAGLVKRAEEWPWGSAFARCNNCSVIPLAEWPILPPGSWLHLLNGAELDHETTLVRRATARNLPIGAADWQARAARDLGLEPSLRRQGRPLRTKEKGPDVKKTPDPFSVL